LINVHAINVDNFFESLRKNAAISQSFITKSFAKQYINADAFFNSRIAISKQLLHHLTYSTNMNKIISKTTSSTNIITTIINSQHLSTINMKQQLQKQTTSSTTISSTIISINTFEALPLATANIQAVKVFSTTQIIHSHFPTTLKIPSLNIYSVPLTTSGIKSSAFISTNTFKALPLTTANTQACKLTAN
jgi:hypothetical protein